MNIAPWILLSLLGLPIVELYVLIKLIGLFGFFITLALLLGAAAVGGVLLRTQGWSNWMRVQNALARGELPAEEIIESGLIALAGLLLILPGLISDGLALVCLIPASRKALARHLLGNRIILRPGPPRGAPDSRTLEGEYRRED